MYCPSCGGKCEEEHRFCFHCGAALPQSAVLPQEEAPAAEITEQAPAEESAEAAPVENPTIAEPPAAPVTLRKGRLWPPIVFMAVMIAIGVLVFFTFGEHIGKDPKLPWFQVKDGTLFFDASVYTGGSKLTVPESIGGQTVTALADGCFSQCSQLTTVILPDTLTEIGTGAFSNCTSMRGIFIPESVKTIGANAFYGCRALESICIPGGISTIGEDAFDSCPNLRHIFFAGPYRTWLTLYSDSIAPDTSVYCADGFYTQPG